jgi:hypothetical protein
MQFCRSACASHSDAKFVLVIHSALLFNCYGVINIGFNKFFLHRELIREAEEHEADWFGHIVLYQITTLL